MNDKRCSIVLASLFALLTVSCGATSNFAPNLNRSEAALAAKSAITGTKRAFLVGINQYQLPDNDLDGCVNDTSDVKSQLLSKEGFNPSNVLTITDQQATRIGIIDGLKKLVAAGQPGDFLCFYYSGHGAQIQDASSDELDALDEILCPTDLKIKGRTFANGVVDDEIETILGDLKPGVGFMMVSDSCHSGTIDRNHKGKAREIILPKNARNLTPMIYDKSRQNTFLSRAAAGKYVLISGCQDEETSAEDLINNRYCGAATYYLLDAYKKGGGAMTYGDWHKNMVAGLIANQYDQRPNLVGPADLKIFAIPE